MVELALPKNSQVKKGRHFPAPADAKKVKTFRIYRYDPEGNANPRWDTYDVAVDQCGPMLLDVLIHIKNTMDATLTFRRSGKSQVWRLAEGDNPCDGMREGFDLVQEKPAEKKPVPSQPKRG